MSEDFSPFRKEVWTREQSDQEVSVVWSEMLDWISERPALAALAATLISFVLLLLGYIFQCGRAIYFGIPLGEVPYETSVGSVLAAIILGSFFLATNCLSYRTLSKKGGTLSALRGCLSQYGTVFAIVFILIFFYAVFGLFAAGTNLGSMNAGDSYLLGLIIESLVSLLVLSVVCWYVTCGLGASAQLADRWNARREERAKEADESVSPSGDMPNQFEADSSRAPKEGDSETAGARLTQALVVFALSGAIILAGTATIGCLSAMTGLGGQAVAIWANGGMTPEALQESETVAGALVVFSEGSSFCAVECELLPNGEVRFESGVFEWFDRESVQCVPASGKALRRI